MYYTGPNGVGGGGGGGELDQGGGGGGRGIAGSVGSRGGGGSGWRGRGEWGELDGGGGEGVGWVGVGWGYLYKFGQYFGKYFDCLPFKIVSYELFRTSKMISEAVRIFFVFIIFKKMTKLINLTTLI